MSNSPRGAITTSNARANWRVSTTCLMVCIFVVIVASACSSSISSDPPPRTATGSATTPDENGHDSPTGDPAGSVVVEVAPEDQLRLVAHCMTEAGFDVTSDPRDGTLSYDAATEAQQQDLDRQNDICREQFPLDERYTKELSDSAQEFLYGWYVSTGRPCLEAAGIAVEEPPTKDTWLATPDAARWRPWMAVHIGSMNHEQWLDLNEQCPQGPPSAELFGR